MANKYANEITEALSKLDPQNAEHWTDDGLPVTRVVQMLANEPGIKRSDINEVAPSFSRVASPVPAAPTAPVEPIAAEVTSEESSDEVSEKEKLQAAYDDAEQALAQARADRTAAGRAEIDAQKRRDVALTKLNAAFPPLTHAQNIQQYIKHETEERARKVGYGSQLDAAMSARRSRGWSRPRIGQMVAK